MYTVCIFLGATLLFSFPCRTSSPGITHPQCKISRRALVADVCFPNRLTEQGSIPLLGGPLLVLGILLSRRISTAASIGFRFLHKNTKKEIYFVPPSAPPIGLINTHCTKRLDDRRDPCLSLGRWLLFVIFKERRKPAVSPNLELPSS
jgi:hypothetical protein